MTPIHRRNVRLVGPARVWKELGLSDILIVLHTAIAILAIVLLILVIRVDPVISLVIGTIYLRIPSSLSS